MGAVKTERIDADRPVVPIVGSARPKLERNVNIYSDAVVADRKRPLHSDLPICLNYK